MHGRCQVDSYSAHLEAIMAERGPDHPIWSDNGKDAGRELGELCDLYLPEIYQGPMSLRKMTEPEHDAVIKPVQGCSSRGVRPLKYEGEGIYLDLFTRQRMSWNEVVTTTLAAKHEPKNLKLLEEGHPDAMRPPWILEELILNESGSLPCDWKGYVFGGRVEAVFQMAKIPRRKSKAIKWWDRNFRDVGDIMPVKSWKYDDTLKAPNNPDALIRAMEDVGELVDSPFIRVDLYERGDQVVFGETTPHPTGGTVHFVPEWDQKLGQAWTNALA